MLIDGRWFKRPPHLSLDERHGSDGLLQGLDLRGGADEQRRPRVNDGLAAALAQTQLGAHRHPDTHTHTRQPSAIVRFLVFPVSGRSAHPSRWICQ